MRQRFPIRIASLVAAAMLVAPAAFAQETDALELAVRDTRLLEGGLTELVVNVTGPARDSVLSADAFTVTEQGQPVGELEVEPLLESGAGQLTVVLALDVSSSMEGEPLERIQEASTETVSTFTDQGIAVGLVEFHTLASVLAEPTTDPEPLIAAIDALEAIRSTALYDGVITAVELLADTDGIGNIIVFADGEDNVSGAGIDDAVEAARSADIPLSIVTLQTDLTDLSVLAPLAEDTGGRLLEVADTDDLTEVFAEVTADIASQYVLRYRSELVDTGTLDLGVTVTSGGTQASTTFVVPNTRVLDEEFAAPRAVESDPGLFADPLVLYGGLLAAFAALLLIFRLLFVGSRTTGDRNLNEQLARYIESGDPRAGRSSVVSAHFRDRAMELLESTPRPKGFDARLNRRLEQAAWPLKNAEFLALVVISALGVALLVGFTVNWLGGILLGIVAGAVPFVILQMRLTRRHDLFLKQLPDTLQLMAGSLRAGYGVLQSIDSVAKESAPPTAEEFGRVLTEARLGMAVEDALEEMADRIDNADFRWVVLAINIQREVGGNLAELLDTVSEVLREREMLRRQVKVLSAEGRLSAYILIGLPIFLAIYLVLVNPEYISTLVTSGAFGYLLIGGAVVFMLAGVVWIRNLIRIEV